MRKIELVAWVTGVVAFTFAVHEAAHGIAGAALGYDVFVRVNSSGLVTGDYRSATDAAITDVAGPLVTLLQGLVGVTLVPLIGRLPAFALVLAALAMRMLAAAASLRLPNDEARLGLFWQVGYWTVHTMIIALLAVATYRAARRLRIGGGDIAWCSVTAIVAMVAVIIAEPYLPTLYL